GVDERQLGERCLDGDDVVIADGIERPHDVDDIGVLEATDHMDDGVHFADVGEELIAQPLALRGALHEAGDVDELDNRGNLFLRLDDLVELLETRVGDFDDADVRLDRAKGIVLRRRRLRGRERVEERRLAYVGQPDNAKSQHPSRNQRSTASITSGMSDSTCSSCSCSNGASTYSA